MEQAAAISDADKVRLSVYRRRNAGADGGADRRARLCARSTPRRHLLGVAQVPEASQEPQHTPYHDFIPYTRWSLIGRYDEVPELHHLEGVLLAGSRRGRQHRGAEQLRLQRVVDGA